MSSTLRNTFATVLLANPARADEATVELLVDSGARYSVVPASLLEALGIAGLDRQPCTRADDTRVAPEGATPLLGAMTLESLGSMVNPVTREILPMRLLLARVA